ncbi:MAG TPA: DUF5009 domain-containing protein [Planctomycetaceae bacterium]|nr:DUF5009 domain-containing protein [Planctomycetaceae bacterium]
MQRTKHPRWNGYEPWDQIFPLFMFIVGVAVPYSLAKRTERGESRSALYWRVIRRGLTLVLLGMIFNGLLRFDFAHQRYPSVLGRIGLTYLFATLIAMNVRVRGLIVSTLGILIGYWAIMKFVPVPGYGAGDWTPGHTLCGYLDRLLLPGVLYEKVRDPEGILSTLPAIATVLSGILAGHWLRRQDLSGQKKAAGLAVAGVVGVVLGKCLDPVFPINKNLWTSSFVLFTSGWSALLLSVFYLVIDVWQYRRWAFFFVVIGMNAITIYMLCEFVDFRGVFDVVFARASDKVHPALLASGEVLTGWVLLYWMYCRKIFLKV